MLGIDSEFCNVEALVTGIVDNWPQTLLKHRRKFTVGLCAAMFLLGFPMCTNVWISLFQIVLRSSIGSFILPGWCLSLPAYGLLFSQRNVFAVGLLLPNNCHRLVFWSRQILRLCRTNDWTQARIVLVSLLEILCSCCHARKLLRKKCAYKTTWLWCCLHLLKATWWRLCLRRLAALKNTAFSGRFRVLLHLLRTCDLRNRLHVPQMGGIHGPMHEFRLDDVGPRLRHLLRLHPTRILYGGKN